MSTECSPESYDFGRVEGRRLVADFGGGTLTSNGGALLLRQVAKATGLVTRLAGCFTDHRAEERVEYGVPTLLGQRLFGLALGSEDLNDHDGLRHDPLLAACLDRLGAKRKDCAALAGRNTLGRLERSPSGSVTRYHKISHDPAAMIGFWLSCFSTPRRQRPSRSCSISMPPTSRCMVTRRASFFTGLTATIVTCRCTFSATSISWRPSCGRPISTVPPVQSRKSSGSLPKSAIAGRRSAACR